MKKWLKSFLAGFTTPLSPPPPKGSPDPRMHNLTPHAQQALAFARKEADRFNHNFVGTEHLLLGIIKLGEGLAVEALRRLGLNLDAIKAEIEKHIRTGPDQRMLGHIPYTPRVKKVLALARRHQPL